MHMQADIASQLVALLPTQQLRHQTVKLHQTPFCAVLLFDLSFQ